ncbi:MAG: hypothetical protein L3J71_18365 [Victivallaceae bacterium]|nr:hypothetical protein [Victivallaceae bacterium]
MNSRERTVAAANCQASDRIPIDFWAANEVFERLAEELNVSGKEGVLKAFDVDLRYFRGPGFAVDESDKNGIFTDHWGVKRQSHSVNGQRKDGTAYSWTYKHMFSSPLAEAQSVADIEKHAWPSPDRLDYSDIKDSCKAIRDAGYAVVFGGDRLDRTAQLKAGMYLRGTEQFVMDLIIEPAIAESILEYIAAYYLEYNRRVFEAADGNIDIFFMGDDMGIQNSTWVPVEMYRKFFKKRFTKFNELAHNFGIKTMYHTCGKVTDFIPEFIDTGLDILQSLQPGAMSEDFLKIKQKFGRDLCFQGGIDIQHILPQGSPEDIRQHVKAVVNTLGSNSGYIFGTSHNILPETPTENILALIEAYHEFG